MQRRDLASLPQALLEEVWRDLVFAFRMLVRHPGFTAAAATTLALGIGATTAVFSIVDTVVFRPLPYREPNQLVKIWDSASASPVDDVSLPDFLDVRSQNGAFESMAADDGRDFAVSYRGSQESANGAVVTADWLSTLGIQPMLGRAFLPEETQPGHDRVVILTQAYWRRRFASDPDVVGQMISIDGAQATIVGVLPPNVLRYGADFLKPLVAAEYPSVRGHRDLDVFARLRPGVSLTQAQVEVQTIAKRLELEYPATNKGHSLRVVPLDKYYANVQPRARQGLILMFAAVVLVLLIACVNVANLLLARAVGRYRECVVRTALGASRFRIVRQLLVENVLLFLIGGTLGCLLAQWSVDSLLALATIEGYVPDRLVVAIDGRVLAFSLLVSLATGLTFGLAPALQASRVDVNDGLRDSSVTLSHGGRGRGRRALIVAEMTLSLVLLVGFGLLVRSFIQVQATSGGFKPERLLETGSDGGREFAPALAFWRAGLERAQAVPGVESVAVTSRPPVHGARRQSFAIGGRAPLPGDPPQAGDILVSADYFRAMGIPVVQGRAFTELDTASAPPVVIVSQSFARQQFPNDDPLGKAIRIDERGPMTCCSTAGPVENVWREIVGVVGDIRQGNLDETPAATIYRPYTQIVEHDMYLMARVGSTADRAGVAAELRTRLNAVDASRTWWDVRPMEQVIYESESIRLRRFVLILLGSFATLALLLAAVGLYGVMACFVIERRREIGIRVALGATRPVVIRQVLAEAGRLAVTGLVLGCLSARLLTQLISTMLFGVSSTDAVTYVSVSLVLGGVALFASYVPARRAARVDPMLALR